MFLEVSEVFAGTSGESRSELWSVRMSGVPTAGQTYTNTTEDIVVMRLQLDHESGTTELTGMESKESLFGLHCGFHLRMKDDLVFVQGKFTNDTCDTTFFDRDCLKILENDTFQRVDLQECYSETNLDVTTLSMDSLDHSSFSFADLSKMMATKPGQYKGADESVSADGERPALEVNLSNWGRVESMPLTPDQERLSRISSDNSPVSGNCNYTSGQSNNFTMVWELPLSNLSTEELARLNVAIDNQSVFVGYNLTIPQMIMGETAVSQAVSATAQLLNASGSELKQASLAAHTVEGAYVIDGLFDATVSGSEKIRVTWTGTLSLDCPEGANSGDQGSIRFSVQDLKLRY